LERERLENAKLRLKAGQGTKADLDTAQKRFEDARGTFCKFLEKAEFVD
jgi:outer membrane protein TolC